MIVSWPVLKGFVDAKLLSIQWYEDDNTYFLKAIDGFFSMECQLYKNNANSHLAEFEATYKALGNTSFSDIDGIPLCRLKASKKGWSFWALPPEITTSTVGGTLYCKDADDNDIPGITCKIYNAENAEITSPGENNENLLACTKTVLDVENPFDVDLIGGALRVSSKPTDNLRLWIVGAPDIPKAYGGSKEFASGINLKFLSADNEFSIDGRVSKYITWNSSNHSGKIRFIFKHPTGLTVNLQMVIHLYRL